jgi:hypothetical protein
VFGAPRFVLTDGANVPNTLGSALINHPNLVATDPPLVAGGLPQTLRFTAEPRRADP